MTDANAYAADPARIQGGVRQVEQISTAAEAMLREFLSHVNLTRGWPGVDDTFAQANLPNEKKERETVTDTAQAMSGAIVAIAHGTNENLKNIMTTQAGNMAAIHQSAGGDSTDVHTGKH